MGLAVGEIVTGKVTGITGFGAFVDLGNRQTGLVHISEVSSEYVKDIHDVLAVGDEVAVKVTKIGSDGKIALSIRKANSQDSARKSGQADSKRHSMGQPATTPKPRGTRANHQTTGEFDDLLSNFLKESEHRLSDIKKNTEGKRGGRGGRRK
ncbi:RNA binding protein, contains ribosomal protein S1 [Fructilactobacillus florum 8D]|uniref:RNA binding protein, contains ribosomal protein S1 n=1 Tax=Fructilactobacillus florum 8D TaxID=1221538 RepID=W9EEA9_9LACO|nr:S1 domain-containing RNA-binding protein [Fructilactobacillus florum]ETO40392.1 RNA binding protein, contains ribosomal protein S1 [Fructilactobacillus florum 8D]